jgi:hypothetical protein
MVDGEGWCCSVPMGGRGVGVALYQWLLEKVGVALYQWMVEKVGVALY